MSDVGLIVVLTVSVSYISHLLLYLNTAAPPRHIEPKGDEYRSRIVSDFHAWVAVSVMCAYIGVYGIGGFLDDIPSAFHGAGTGTNLSRTQYTILSAAVCWSLGYFLCDTTVLFVLSPHLRDAAMVVHHSVCIATVTLGLVTNGCGTAYHALFLMEEISTLALNRAWRLRKKSHFAPRLLFAVLFFVIRCVLGTYLVFSFIASYPLFRASLFLRGVLAVHITLAVASRVLNFVWLWKIVRNLCQCGGDIPTTPPRKYPIE